MGSTTDTGDLITIYNGFNTSAPVLGGPWTLAQLLTNRLNIPIVANSGAITIRWVSDASTETSGWEANWTSTGALLSYAWTPTTGLDDPTAFNPRATPTATTTYTLEATTPDGCLAIDQVTVTVDPLVVDAGPNRRIACGDSVQVGPINEVRVNETRTYLPSGTFYDSGGRNGNYAPNQNMVYTIAPPNATSVTLTFTGVGSTTDTGDLITIYNGFNTSAPVLAGPWTLAQLLTNRLNIPIVANSGAITIRWVSDASTETSGWEANWTSTGSSMVYDWTPTTGLSDPTSLNPLAAPGATTTYTLNVSTPDGCAATDQVTVTVDPFVFQAGPNYSIACGDSVQIGPVDTVSVRMTPNGHTYYASGFFYDSGGPSGNYAAADAFTYTINPIGASSVTLTFLSRAGDTGDGLVIYDGFGTSGPILMSAAMNALPLTPITAPSGVMTIRIYNDADATSGAGFAAYWTSDAYTGLDFSWSPTTGLSDPTALRPMAAPTVPTTYTLTVSTPSGCSSVSSATVTPLTYTIDVGPDANFVCGDSVQLGIAAQTFLMSNNTTFLPSGRLFDAGGVNGNYGMNQNATFVIAPPGASSLVLNVPTRIGTDAADIIRIYDGLDVLAPLVYSGTVGGMAASYTLASGKATIRFTSNATTDDDGFEFVWDAIGAQGLVYAWSPAAGLDNPSSPTPKASPAVATTYTLSISTPGGACVVTDNLTITPTPFTFSAGPDMDVFCGDSAEVGWLMPNVNMANGSTYFPSGRLFDSGGPAGDYGNSQNLVYTIRPVGASSVSLQFLFRAGTDAEDRITLYDGPDVYSPILAGPMTISSFAATSYVANSGAMTIRFNSDAATTAAGWEAIWNSTGADYAYSWSPTTGLSNPNVARPLVEVTGAAPVTYTLTVTTPTGCVATDDVVLTPISPAISAGLDRNLVCGDSLTLGPDLRILNMQTTTIYDVRGVLYDNGGAGGNYTDGQSHTLVIAPPYEDEVRLRFVFRSGTDVNDLITIYDGEGTDGPRLYGPGTISSLATTDYVATSGAMTIRFSSNASSNFAGWEARWSTVQNPVVTYQWTPSTGLSSTTELNPRVSITAAPVTYTLTMNGPGSCDATDDVTITPQSFTFDSPDVTAMCGETVRIGYTGVVANIATATTFAPKGRLYDAGGPNAPYPNNGSWVYSIRPIGATRVTLRFLVSSGTDVGDHITIYDGPDVTAPVLVNMVALNNAALAAPIVANSGMMTIRHVSNAATQGDFEALWTAVQPGITYTWSPTTGIASPDSMNTLLTVPAVATTYSLTVVAPGTCSFVDQVVVTPTPLVVNAGPDVTMYCGDSLQLGNQNTVVVNMPTTGFSREPSGIFFDSGGQFGQYLSNDNRIYTIRPAGAGTVSLRFLSVTGTDVEDRMTIYDGPDENAPRLFGPAALNTLSTALPYTASSGVMTIRFQTDGSSTNQGWHAEWTSTPAAGVTYSWTPSFGLSAPTARYPWVNVLDGDVRTYRLTVSTPSGCSDWDEITVRGLGYSIELGPNQAQSCGDSLTIGMVPAEVNMTNNGSSFMPYGNFYDSGGPAGNYLATDNLTYVIRPLGATRVSLRFNSRTGDTGDLVTLYDGPDVNSPIIGA